MRDTSFLVAPIKELKILQEWKREVQQILFNATFVSRESCDKLGAKWQKDADLNGRFLIGAGPGYKAGKTGGKYRVKLKVSEMPSHNHATTTWKVASQAGMNNHNKFHNSLQGDGSKPVGGRESHENTPPYYSIYFCKMKNN